MPPVILAGLYSKSLVVINEEISPSLQKNNLSPSAGGMPTATSITEDVVSEDPLLFETIPARVNKISWLGEFKKQVAIVVDDENGVYSAEAELDLLTKMLQALKLSLADVALININKQEVSWNGLSIDLPAKAVIFFGVDPAVIGVPMRFPHFKVHRWNDTKFLYSPALAVINKPGTEQTRLKKELWRALQEMFIPG